MAGSTLDTILLTDTFHTWFIRTNQAIEELNTVIDSGISAAGLSGDHLWLYLHGGITFDVGHVVGETGPGISFGGLSGADLVFTKTDGSLLTIANVKGEQGLQGVQGQQGPQGPTGSIGPAGQGVPTGGTQGYVLTKGTSGDYDTQWTDVTAIVKKKPGLIGSRQYDSNAGVRPNSYIYLSEVHAGASITQDVMRGFTSGWGADSRAGAGQDILNWQFNDEFSSTGGWHGGNFTNVNQDDALGAGHGAQYFTGPTLKLIPMYIPTYTVFRRYVMWIDDIGTAMVGGHTFDHFGSDNTVGGVHVKNAARFYTRESEDGRQFRFYSQLGHGEPNVNGRDHYFTNQGNTAAWAGKNDTTSFSQGGGSGGLAEHAQGMYLRMALLNTKNGEPNKLVAGSTSEWYLKGATGWTAPGNRKAKYQGHGSHTPYHVGASGPHGFTCGAGATGAFLEPGWYWMYFECIPAAWVAHHPDGYADNAGSNDLNKVVPKDRNKYTTIIIPHTDYDKGRGTDLIGLDSWDLAPTNRQNAFRSHIADLRSNDGTTNEMGWSAAAYPDGGTGYAKQGTVGSTGAQSAYWSPTHYMASNGIHVTSAPEFSGSWCIVLGHYTGFPMLRPTWAPNFGLTGTQDMSHATGGISLVDDRTYQPEPIHGIAGQNTSGGKGIFRPQNIYQARCPRVGIEIYKTFESSEDASGGGYEGPIGGGA